ncbi:hypothetical protein [Kaarinaea lacus]
MKKLFATIILFVFSICLTPVAFSADSISAYNECKSEAEKNEVELDDMNTFISNCMAELDVAAADIKALLEPENAGGEKAKDE